MHHFLEQPHFIQLPIQFCTYNVTDSTVTNGGACDVPCYDQQTCSKLRASECIASTVKPRCNDHCRYDQQRLTANDLCWQHVTIDVWWQNFSSKSRVWDKVPEGSTLIFGDTQIFFFKVRTGRKKPASQKPAARSIQPFRQNSDLSHTLGDS